MRTLILVTTVALCSPFAGARERRTNRAAAQVVKKGDSRLAAVDDEPMSERAVAPVAAAVDPDEVGSRKVLRVEAPVFTPVPTVRDDGAIVAHGVRAVVERRAEEP